MTGVECFLNAGDGPLEAVRPPRSCQLWCFLQYFNAPLDLLTLCSIPLLDLSNQPIVISLHLIEVTIGQLSPLFLDRAAGLAPLSLPLVFVYLSTS